jgi:hypothetical protein
MLFTDSIFVQPADLTRIDAEATTVATTEGVTLTGPNGLIRAAQEEVAMELQKQMIAFGGYLNSGDLSANHLAAVLNIGIGNSVRQKALLVQVPVTDAIPGSWSWIYQYCVYWTLKVLYRNVFSRTVNDRYKQKLDYYSKEIEARVSKNVTALGIPIVLQPLSAPAAFYEANSGTWGQSNVSTVAGSGSTTGPYDVAITYCSMAPNWYVSPAMPNNAESAPSSIITVPTYSPGQVLSVSIATLNPPTGAQSPATLLICVVALLQATHWNIYAGTSGGTLYLQNSAPIPVSQKTYVLPSDPIVSAYPLGMGQYQTRRLSIVPTRQRA